MANPMAPTNPAPRTACARGAAAPVKAGAACVIDEGAFEEGTLRKTELETVMDEMDVELELEAMAGATGVDEELETTDVVKTPQVLDDDELVTTGATGEIGTTGMNEEMDDHGPHVVELLLGMTGATGEMGATGVLDEELLKTTEVVHTAQVSDEELVVTGKTGVTGMTGVDDDEEDDHTPQVSDEEELVVTGRTGVTGMTGVDDDEEDDHTPQVSDEELVFTGRTGVTGMTGVDELLLADHGPHIVEEELVVTGRTGVTGETGVDELLLEFADHGTHSTDVVVAVLVVVTVTGGIVT
jgi:hypothetical protein